MAYTAIRVKSDTKVHLFAVITFNLRKEPPYNLSIVPDVRAGAVAAAYTLPGPEPSVFKAVTGTGGQSGGVCHSSIKKPIRQG